MTSLEDFQKHWEMRERQAVKLKAEKADLMSGSSSQSKPRAGGSELTKSLPNIRRKSPGTASRRSKLADLQRSYSTEGHDQEELEAMMNRPWPEGGSTIKDKNISDFDIDKNTFSDEDNMSHHQNYANIPLRNPFVDMIDGSPVEIVLIDRSKSKDSVRRLRIDEHMNVSIWHQDNKTRSIVIGIVIFSVVVLVTGLTVMFAGDNSIDHEAEYDALVSTMDWSSYRVPGDTPSGWDLWQMKLPTPPGYFNSTHTLDDMLMDYGDYSEAEEPIETQSYTAFILLSEDHEERWLKAQNSVVLTFLKGSRLEIITNIFKGQLLFSHTTYYLGDSYIHGDDAHMTSQVVLPPDENFTVYIKITIAMDGYRVYGMMTVQSIEDMVSHILDEDALKVDIISLPLSLPWTDEDECEETVLCL